MTEQEIEQSPETDKQRNLFVDLIMATIVALVLGVGGYFAYQHMPGTQSDISQRIVIFDATAVAEKLTTGDSELSAKEVKESLEREAQMLSDQGYIVLRKEMIWSAPDEYFQHFE